MPYTVLAEKLLENMIFANKSQAFSKLAKISHGEMFALHIISTHNGDITPSDISKIAGTSPARIAAELNSLEHKGLITREIDPNNRRRILVCLTPDGIKGAKEHHKEAMQIATDLLLQLGEKDAREYVQIMGKLGGNS